MNGVFRELMTLTTILSYPSDSGNSRNKIHTTTSRVEGIGIGWSSSDGLMGVSVQSSGKYRKDPTYFLIALDISGQ